VKPIDWRAVDSVLDGHTITTLSPRERRMVARRLKWRMNSPGVTSIFPGILTTDDLAARLGCTDRHAQRLLDEMAPALRQVCPVCGGDMWVLVADGVVEEHPDSLRLECPLSGFVLSDLDAAALTMVRSQWLAAWMRADLHGATAYLRSLPRWQIDGVAVVALAAFPEQRSVGELTAWVDEVVA